MCEYEEARKQSDHKIMLSDTWRETFGNSFQELREALTHRDFAEATELVDHLQRVACNLVEQFDSLWAEAHKN